ncbi:MAG: hypothetical protein AB8V03_02190 [Francisella endosymbiont of Hyalomma asiaticum]
MNLNIYGYLFWVVIVLGIINVWAVFRIGKPLKELYIVSRNMKQTLYMAYL